MNWAETLKGDVWTCASISHTTNSEGDPPPFEYLDRTRPVRVSYADMKVIRRNGKNKKI